MPEVAMFQPGFRSYLWAAATPVEPPPGFWHEPLVIRQALFFREVVRRTLPVQILDGELIVGAWHELNDTGVGNCAAVPGHLVPD